MATFGIGMRRSIETARCTPVFGVTAIDTRACAPIVKIQIVCTIVMKHVCFSSDQLFAMLVNRQLDIGQLHRLAVNTGRE